MKRSRASRTGLALYASLSLLVVAGGIFIAAQRPRQSGRVNLQPPVLAFVGAKLSAEPVEVSLPRAAPSAVLAAESSRRQTAAALVERLATLVLHDPTDVEREEWAHIEDELVALGEIAVPALVQRIDALRGAAPARDRWLSVLRRLPGRTAEERLIREARSGSSDSSRTIAIESLGDRRTDRAIEALARIVETDPDLPAHTLMTSPRASNEISTELPDEVVFTPRMQALAALATTRAGHAAEVLTAVLKDGPDESLRMQAARHLETFRETPETVDALRAAATADPSPYVRLAALHSLAGSADANLAPMLRDIAARDGDAGVRALAQQLLVSLSP